MTILVKRINLNHYNATRIERLFKLPFKKSLFIFLNPIHFPSPKETKRF